MTAQHFDRDARRAHVIDEFHSASRERLDSRRIAHDSPGASGVCRRSDGDVHAVDLRHELDAPRTARSEIAFDERVTANVAVHSATRPPARRSRSEQETARRGRARARFARLRDRRARRFAHSRGARQLVRGDEMLRHCGARARSAPRLSVARAARTSHGHQCRRPCTE